MRTPLPRHFSDETLLAYADGELPPRAVRRTRLHLDSCWRCRTRLAELEEQTRRLAAAFEQQVYPGSGAIEVAKGRFLDRAQREQMPGTSAPAVLAVSSRSRVGWAAVSAAAIVCAVPFYFWSAPPRKPAPDAQALLRTAAALESQKFNLPAPVHQDFAVEIEQRRPQAKRQRSRLQVWAEGGGQRFAARWESEKGELKYAAWQPAAGEQSELSPLEGRNPVARRGNRPAPTLVRTLTAGARQSEQIEEAFFQWLKNREWTPLSLSAEFASFAAEDGVLLHASRGAGGEVLTLSAERTEDDLRLELVLELDPTTLRPRVQVARIATGLRESELRLTSLTRSDAIPVIEAAVFRPPPRQRGIPSTIPDANAPTHRPTVVEDEDLERAEVEILYALHRAGLCRGEPVEVTRTEKGLLVSAIAETPEERSTILTALDGVARSESVTVHVRTAGDEASGMAREATTIVARPVEEKELPVQEALDRRLAGAASAQARHEEVARLSHATTILAEALLAESWAIRKLALRFPAEDGQLRPQSRWLVEVMVRDHLMSLSNGVREVRSVLSTVLPASRQAVPPSEAGNYVALFEQAKKVHGLLLAAFAGGDDPGMTGEELLAAIADGLNAVESRSQEFAARLAWNAAEVADEAPGVERERKPIE